MFTRFANLFTDADGVLIDTVFTALVLIAAVASLAVLLGPWL